MIDFHSPSAFASLSDAVCWVARAPLYLFQRGEDDDADKCRGIAAACYPERIEDTCSQSGVTLQTPYNLDRSPSGMHACFPKHCALCGRHYTALKCVL